MTPEHAANQTRDATVRLPARFMNDAATFARGAELGIEGFDFYIAGRGGALGDVPADVVIAAFVFLAPEHVRSPWERTAHVPRRDAAEAWMDCAHRWAREHLSGDTDWTRVAELLGRIVTAAPVAGVPLFAGARTLPEPADAPALALHRLSLLRELRGGLHGAATLTVGLTPVEAISVLVPKMLPVLGWPDEPADPEPLQERWRLAEARTDRMLGRHFGVLDDDERTELVEALQKAST